MIKGVEDLEKHVRAPMLKFVLILLTSSRIFIAAIFFSKMHSAPDNTLTIMPCPASPYMTPNRNGKVIRVYKAENVEGVMADERMLGLHTWIHFSIRPKSISIDDTLPGAGVFIDLIVRWWIFARIHTVENGSYTRSRAGLKFLSPVPHPPSECIPYRTVPRLIAALTLSSSLTGIQHSAINVFWVKSRFNKFNVWKIAFTLRTWTSHSLYFLDAASKTW